MKTKSTQTIKTKTPRKGRPPVYNLQALQVGRSRHLKLSSILVNREDATTFDKRNTVAASASQFAKRNAGRKFSTSVDENRGIIIVTRTA